LGTVVKAAEFLQAHNIPWPPVMTEIIDILMTHREAMEAASGDTIAEVRLLPPPDPTSTS
jgi:hypothetical protein